MFTSPHQAIAAAVYPAHTALADLNPAPSPTVAGQLVAQTLRLPFDVVRAQYACAVRTGLVERSMLAGARFENNLGLLERSVLGPWARHRRAN